MKKNILRLMVMGFAILIVCGSGQAALANSGGGNTGTTGGVTGGLCASGSEGTYFDICFGATWRYYKTDSDYVYEELPPNYNVENDAVEGCGTWGGGYYRLGLERYDPRTFLSQNIEQVGFMQVRNIGFPYGGGSSNFRAPGTFNVGIDANSSVPQDWDVVKQAFDDAKDYAQKLKERGIEFGGNLADTKWEDAAWFCWKEGGFEDGQAHFLSNSTVEIPAQEGIVQARKVTAESINEKMQHAEVQLTTEQETVTANFWHNMFWRHEDEDGNVLDDTVNPGDDICTTYRVADQDGNILVADKSYCATGAQYQASGKGSREKAVAVSTVPINLEKGQTKKVCQKISFVPEQVKIGGDAEADGDGWSEACVMITRVGDPEGEVSVGTSNEVMYAGEDGPVSWSTSATGTETLRILGWQAIAYQVPVDVTYRDDIAEGSFGAHSDLAPCAWFQVKVGKLRSGCIASEPVGKSESYGGLGYVGTVSYNATRQVVVPDNVGDKYCVSFGFHWQAYDGITNEETGEIEYVRRGEPYWTNYGASCKTIAKKPTVAIWNGSLFTNGRVKTSLASRYLDPKFGETVETAASERKKFGSWVEYLAVVGGSVDGFASGASLAFRGFDVNTDLLAMSPLTIANSDSDRIGYSGVSGSSTFKSRLNSYLYNNSNGNITHYDNLDSAIADTDSQTKVVTMDGEIDINKSLELGNDRTYNSIYDLPQLVIYAKGDINIGPEVTRIDAWLITDGTVNTCSGFDDSTEAYVNGYNADTERCSKSLQINGPVIARDIELNRTAGADLLTYTDITKLGSSTDARTITAEVFNLSAETYLWAYAQAGRYGSSYTETYTRELPPRY